MSDTPRCDFETTLRLGEGSFNPKWLPADFARQLERELNSAKATLTQLYHLTDPYADGAPDASSHDKLCNEISSICKPFVTIL